MTDDVGILGINYDELADDPQSTYDGTKAEIGNKRKVFRTNGDNNVHVDVINAWNWLVNEGASSIILTSSFDNFLLDGNKWKWDDENLITQR